MNRGRNTDARRRARALAALGLSAALCVPAAADEPIPLTLADAVKLALAQSAAVVEAGERSAEADLGLRLARSAFTPKITPALVGSLGERTLSNQSYGFTGQQMFATGTRIRGALTAQSSRNQLGSFFFNDTTLSITQPLLRNADGAAAVNAVRAAESRVAAAAHDRRAVEQETIVQVAAAYYQLLSNRSSSEIAAKSLERSRQLADAAQARLTAGRVSRLDVLRARQLVAESESQFVHAESATADSLDDLRLLLRLPADRPILYDRELRLPALLALPGDPVAAALGQRADLSAADQAVREAERAVAAARGLLRPQLEVGMAVTRQTVSDRLADSFGLRDFKVAAIGSFVMPFDQTAEQVQLRTATIERDRKARELDVLRATVSVQVQRAIRQQERAAKAIALTETAVSIAREQIDVARTRYELGLSDNLDVVNAELESLLAETRHAAAQAELALSRLRLRQTLGILQTSDLQ